MLCSREPVSQTWEPGNEFACGHPRAGALAPGTPAVSVQTREALTAAGSLWPAVERKRPDVSLQGGEELGVFSRASNWPAPVRLRQEIKASVEYSISKRTTHAREALRVVTA